MRHGALSSSPSPRARRSMQSILLQSILLHTVPSILFISVQSILLTLLDLRVSSLRRGHANFLCTVPILADDPRRESISVQSRWRHRYPCHSRLPRARPANAAPCARHAVHAQHPGHDSQGHCPILAQTILAQKGLFLFRRK